MILLENQSTLDLIYNKIFTSELKKSKKNMNVKIKGGTLLVNQSSKIPGYNQTTCFIKKVITSIVSLKNTSKQYRVTYDSNDKNFVV